METKYGKIMTKKILITGASGAFGSMFVNDLIAAGHAVAAAMRDPNGRNKSASDALTAAGAIILDIDVTDEASVNKGVVKAIGALGGLDVLINNAGGGAHGLLEAFTPDQMLRLYDINIVGNHRMMRAVLPEMRAQNSGLILNVSSLLGRLSLPFYGAYSATKFAVETLSETARVELSRYGVDVALIEPGGFPTSFMYAVQGPADQERLSQYGDYASVPPMALKGFQQAMQATPAQDPQRVSDTVLEVVNTAAGERNFRNVVDFMGMGEQVEAMNAQLKAVTEGLYAANGTAAMLTLKVK